MEILQLKQESLLDWAGFIPEELFLELMRGGHNMYAVGVTFQDEPQGVLCWEEKKSEWILRSIYVHPNYRRLRLGSELVAYLSQEMEKKNCERLAVSYEQAGERETLTPFLIRCGFMMEAMDIPLGVTTLENIIAQLQEYNALKKKGRIRSLDQLSKRERYLCNEWMFDEIGESISSYVQGTPTSFVLMREDEIHGMLLLSEEMNTISLDYCWIRQDSKANFFPLLVAAAKDLYVNYPAETRIEMILSTRQAESLYVRLLGEVRDRTIMCKGLFSPIPKEMLISF